MQGSPHSHLRTTRQSPLPALLNSKPFMLGVLWPLLFGSFFGTLQIAALNFPGQYDWRYRVISNLLSPRDNPHMYWIASIGISLAGLLMIPFIAQIQYQLAKISGRTSRVVAFWFYLGTLALIASALVVPQHSRTFLGTSRWHEIFADTAAVGVAVGMLGATFCIGSTRLGGKVPVLFWSWSFLAVLPVIGATICELLLMFSHSRYAAAKAVKEVLGHSVFWHLGFWEWLGACAVFLFFGVGASMLPCEISQESEEVLLPPD